MQFVFVDAAEDAIIWCPVTNCLWKRLVLLETYGLVYEMNVLIVTFCEDCLEGFLCILLIADHEGFRPQSYALHGFW